MSILLEKDAEAYLSLSLPLAYATTSCSSPSPRIQTILVDDDEGYAEIATEELAQFGFDVRSYSSGEMLLANPLALKEAEIVVIDWTLPRAHGTELMRELRERSVDLPVVFLSDLPEARCEVIALDHGAFDFVDKARGFEIIAKRLRMAVRWSRRERTHGVKPGIRISALELQPELMRALWKGEELDLTSSEFNIVYLLASRCGEYVNYRAVYDCVHGIGFIAGSGSDGFRANVRSSIKRIRTKFRAVDPVFREIENFAAVGYRWRRELARVMDETR
jgi:two-component system response regulator ChvI